MLEPLLAEFNKNTIITNSTLFVVDFDSKPEEIEIQIEDGPKFGKLFLADVQLTSVRNKFAYSSVLSNQLSYRLEDKTASRDEIRLRISDGTFSTVTKLLIKKLTSNKSSAPVVEKNEGLQAISGEDCFFFYFVLVVVSFILFVCCYWKNQFCMPVMLKGKIPVILTCFIIIIYILCV
jgi:hypothetical protein